MTQSIHSFSHSTYYTHSNGAAEPDQEHPFPLTEEEIRQLEGVLEELSSHNSSNVETHSAAEPDSDGSPWFNATRASQSSRDAEELRAAIMMYSDSESDDEGDAELR